MKKEFLVEKCGQIFVKYAGLLDEARQSGLKSVITSIAQVNTPDNGDVAICQATVVMLDADGVERIYTGIGDASPANVNPAMHNCLLRMAETRAKARALRDAINVAMCSVEELGSDAEQTGAVEASRPLRVVAQPQAGKCTHCKTSNQFHKPGCPGGAQKAA